MNTYNDYDKAEINLHMTNSKHFRVFGEKDKNHLKVKLNDKPEWEFVFNIGASKANFDLSPYKVSSIDLHTGASSTKIKLGDKSSYVDVYVEMGMASLTLAVPENTGCRIDGSTFLVSKDLPGFRKDGNGDYETENYNTAVNKVDIRLKGGLAA